MFHYVLDCSKLFQVVQLSCFSWFWRLLETVFGFLHFDFWLFRVFQVFSSYVGSFRSSWVNQALQVVLGRFGSLCYSICFGSFTL